MKLEKIVLETMIIIPNGRLAISVDMIERYALGAWWLASLLDTKKGSVEKWCGSCIVVWGCLSVIHSITNGLLKGKRLFLALTRN